MFVKRQIYICSCKIGHGSVLMISVNIDFIFIRLCVASGFSKDLIAECWFLPQRGISYQKWRRHNVGQPCFAIFEFKGPVAAQVELFVTYKQYSIGRNGGMSVSAVKGRCTSEMKTPFLDPTLEFFVYYWLWGRQTLFCSEESGSLCLIIISISISRSMA